MSLTFAVVSNFSRWRPEAHPFRIALEKAGLGYMPVPLEKIAVKATSQNGVELSIPGLDVQDCCGVEVDCILWRISENDYLQCASLLKRISQSYPLVNSISCLERCSNKWQTYVTLASVGLPIVTTQVILPGSLVPDLGTKNTIIKPCFGAGGRGIRALQPGLHIEFDEPHIAQPELSSDSDEHVRVLVCGGKPVVAIRRISAMTFSADGKVKINNLDAGGLSVGAPLSEVYEIAAAASRAVGGSVVGVDLIPGPGPGFSILEVNSTPGLEGANRHSVRCVYDLAVEAILADMSM